MLLIVISVTVNLSTIPQRFVNRVLLARHFAAAGRMQVLISNKVQCTASYIRGMKQTAAGVPTRPAHRRVPCLAAAAALEAAPDSVASSRLPLVEVTPAISGDLATLQPVACFHDEYTMGEELGEGAYGRVCVATHNVSGQQFAAKQLPIVRNDVNQLDEILSEVSTPSNCLYAWDFCLPWQPARAHLRELAGLPSCSG